MPKLISKNPLVKIIAEGNSDPDMLNLLLQKQLPFTETDYLEAFVFVLKNNEYKKKAIENIKNISDGTKNNYIENDDLNINVAYYILLESLSLSKNEILVKIIQNTHLPIEFLKKIAEKGNTETLESLSENQIKLIAFPEIIDLMEKNTNINNFTRGKLDEIRKFYLTKEKAEKIEVDGLTDEIFSIATSKIQKENDIKDQENENENESKVETEEEDEVLLLEEVEEKVVARFQEINNMTVAERVKTALLGTQADRAMLIRDSNKLVSMSVIQSPKLTIEEICSMAKNKSLAGELIGKIAKKKSWTKSYQVMLALISNPKTPVSDALGFLKKLHTNDLKLIKRDKNISPVVRKFANEIQSQKG